MTGEPSNRPGSSESSLRRGVLALAVVGGVGIWLELALARHWKGFEQILPWIAVGVVLLAAALIAVLPRSSTLVAARICAVIAIAAGGFGVFRHVDANYEAAPLDAVYGPRWDEMGEIARWWHALIESVGPSPSFAPGALMLISACVLLATLRHPRLRGSRGPGE